MELEGKEKAQEKGIEVKVENKGERVKEKRRERPELKVVICKDGRSSARVSFCNSFSRGNQSYMVQCTNIDVDQYTLIGGILL